MERRNPVADENVKLQRLIEVAKSALPPDGGPQYNRLIFSKSPYLLQHAENPVDWYQWGDEAFTKAANDNKPVFLSIGYATCHWCHVMERESFEDRDIADLFNRYFISIKVDREERPDVDDQYMAAAQILSGGGGWPLNLFLTPDRKPFYAFTYAPKSGHHGVPGLAEIAEHVAQTWQNQQDAVKTSGSLVFNSLVANTEMKPAPIPGSNILDLTFAHLGVMYDNAWGGFGSAPKFPKPLCLSFLTRFWSSMNEPKALEMVEHSLQKMRNGGIYDQLGFGFHRYSVDQKWLVPHFEKMLYDQAMLALCYLEVFQATQNVRYKVVAEEILTFVEREMTSPEGGFYSARDAETEGVEGKYYTWTLDEVKSIVGAEAANILSRFYDITQRGNFEGENILHLDSALEEFAEREGIPAAHFFCQLEEWRKQMLKARGNRVKPLRDEKILTSWNGLMIAALAKGFGVTRERRWLNLAENAVKFISDRLTRDGRLMHSHYMGHSLVTGFLDDHAFLIAGLIELYEATLIQGYLHLAIELSEQTVALFGDETSYGLFDTASDAENVLVRKKSSVDGVVPSGNAVAAMNFLKLGKITGKSRFAEEGEGILRSMMGDALQRPAAHLYALMALDYLHGRHADITLVGNPKDPVMEEMLHSVAKYYIPHLALRSKEEGGADGYRTIDGKPTAFICHNGLCRPPVSGRAGIEKTLDEVVFGRATK